MTTSFNVVDLGKAFPLKMIKLRDSPIIKKTIK